MYNMLYKYLMLPGNVITLYTPLKLHTILHVCIVNGKNYTSKTHIREYYNIFIIVR